MKTEFPATDDAFSARLNDYFSDCPVERTLQHMTEMPTLKQFLDIKRRDAIDLAKIGIERPDWAVHSNPFKLGYVAGETLRNVSVDDDNEFARFKQNLADAAYCDVDQFLSDVSLLIDVESFAQKMLTAALKGTNLNPYSVDAVEVVKRHLPFETIFIDTPTGERPFFVIRHAA